MVLAIKFRQVLALLLFVFVGMLGCLLLTHATPVHSFGEFANICIVIDAGHGGRDGGSSGVSTGVHESELNLKIVKKLESQLRNVGFRVVLTRKDENGLYDERADNKKRSDMERRREIIEKTNPNLVISVHLNSYPSAEVRGAQAFYLKESEESKVFADSIQEGFIKFLQHAKSASNFGDYYLLKCVKAPTVILECGYLSNPDDEMLLINNDYQDKIAYSIMYGIVKYFKVASTTEVMG